MKYVAYDYFDNFYPDILGICDTEADAQELILAAAEEEAILALTEEDVYYQAMYEGVDNFFNNNFEFRKSRHPEVKCKTHYGIALWFMSDRFIIEELGEY